ncbi:hypothetical protein DUNSADRAFT_15345, partial [Dunaliella salina]
RTLVSRASSVKRGNSRGSGSRSPLSHSPRSGSPSSAAGQQRRGMLVVPALPWRAGHAASSIPPPTTSGLLPLNSSTHKLRSIPSLPRHPQLSPLGLDSPPRSPASPQHTQTTHPQEQLLVHDADPLQPKPPSHQQQQQQQRQQQLAQQQWNSAQALRMEAMQKQEQEQQQLQEMARALRASTKQQQQQQLYAAPPQVMHFDLSRHRQQQQQQGSSPAGAAGEFEFAPVLGNKEKKS